MREDYLYNIALQCAELNSKGCACGCAGCQFNIFNYVKDVREASLLKANAYTDYHQKQDMISKNNVENIGIMIGGMIPILLFVALIAWSCSTVKSCFNVAQVDIKHEQPTQLAPIFEPNKVENIPHILAHMQRPGVVRDVNKDGKIDCIDYSITFYHLYGSNALIMINQNPSTGMNHMFVRVRGRLFDFYDVEPQGTPDRYSMGLIWGTKYDPRYNRDVTSQWRQYF